MLTPMPPQLIRLAFNDAFSRLFSYDSMLQGTCISPIGNIFRVKLYLKWIRFRSQNPDIGIWELAQELMPITSPRMGLKQIIDICNMSNGNDEINYHVVLISFLKQFLIQVNKLLLEMDLSFFRDFLDCLADVEFQLHSQRQKLSQTSVQAFSLLKAVTTKPSINSETLKKFFQQFSWELHLISPEYVNKYANYMFLSSSGDPTDDEVLDLGVKLMMKKWGQGGQLNFKQFSVLVTGQEQPPEKATEVSFGVRRKLFTLIEKEIQGLLNIQTFRKALNSYYGNLTDLFQLLTSTQELTLQSLNNLYMMFSIRKDSSQLTLISQRLSLPCNLQQFLSTLQNPKNHKEAKEYKIYYSSMRDKSKKSNTFRDEGHPFMTPKVEKHNESKTIGSTKLQKHEKYQSARKSLEESVSQFSGHVQQSKQGKVQGEIELMAEILDIEKEYIQIKRELLMHKDLDLELVYERMGRQFQDILNECYGSCNFTSFVRFIIPQQEQARYLAFIRYQKNNKLSPETTQKINLLLQEYREKEARIAKLWESVDREVLFRSFCFPRQSSIPNAQIRKYFSERQSYVLLDRMDPLNTGAIYFEYFK